MAMCRRRTRLKYDAPANVSGLGQYASYVLKESDKLFSEKVDMPVKQRIQNKSDLENLRQETKSSNGGRA